MDPVLGSVVTAIVTGLSLVGGNWLVQKGEREERATERREAREDARLAREFSAANAKALTSVASAVNDGNLLTQEVKTATDGMRADLVAATERGASAEGQLQGRKEATAEAAEVAIGVAEVAIASRDAAVVQAEVNATAAEVQRGAAAVQQEAADTQLEAAEERSQQVGETPSGTAKTEKADQHGDG